MHKNSVPFIKTYGFEMGKYSLLQDSVITKKLMLLNFLALARSAVVQKPSTTHHGPR